MTLFQVYSTYWKMLQAAAQSGAFITDDGQIVPRRQRGCADPNCNGTCLRPGAILRDGLVLWPVHDWDIADRERDNLANGHG